jgi:hypothetical protein
MAGMDCRHADRRPLCADGFIRFEAHLAARGGDPLVALHLLRNGTFVTGLVMALAFYMLSSFYLTFAVYLQSGLHQTPMAAGLATLPFAIGFFVASLASSWIMRWLGARTLTLGFGRVGPGNFAPSRSQIPDVTLSRHPARATGRRLPPSVGT